MSNHIVDYEINVHVFGGTASPYLFFEKVQNLM